MKKADATESLNQVIHRVGLLINEPPSFDRAAVV